MTNIHHDIEKKDASLAKRVFARITEEHLTPRPRWEFVFENYFFWGLGAFAVLLGASAFSAIIFEVANVDWRLSGVTHSDFVSFFFDAAPILWVIVFALFLLIGYLNVRRTNHGYRYPLKVIALGAILTSLTLGSAMFASGFGGAVENITGDQIPFHRSIQNRVHSWWFAPEKGLLGGEVLSVAPDVSSFVLRDFKGTLWTIDGSELRAQDLTTVARGGSVRVVGLPVRPGEAVATFRACFVLPGNFQHGSPTPLAIVASTSERSVMAGKGICESIPPYQQLRRIDDAGF